MTKHLNSEILVHLGHLGQSGRSGISCSQNIHTMLLGSKIRTVVFTLSVVL